MISKNTIKLIKSLAHRKYRLKENLFLVEGDKIVTEVLNSEYSIEELYATESFISAHAQECKKLKSCNEVSASEIKKASLLVHPQNSLALCSIKNEPMFPQDMGDNLSLYLDDIQDPGNLGTIIRTCDWFGIEYLICSPYTVDMYNPKVIQASMGSFCRVNVLRSEFDKVETLALNMNVPVFGATLDGQNIYREKLPSKAILVMGNEGKGIQEEIENKLDKKIKIPEFSTGGNAAESLNVSVATAVICSEFKRQNFS